MSSGETHNSFKKLRKRVALFFVLPFTVGCFGFIFSFAKQKFIKSNHEVNFDSDFIIPFFLTLMIVVVVMIQTQGFTSKAKPIVTWPKMKKKRTIVRKTVVVDDDGNIIEDENILKKLEAKVKAAEKKKDD